MKSVKIVHGRLGKSVVAGEDIFVGEEIITFGGAVLRRDELPVIVNPEDDRFLQIDTSVYLGPTGLADDYVNHSCDPNAGLHVSGHAAILVAIRPIAVNEEILWDYSTTMDEDGWEMDCLCGSEVCRKRIRDFKYLPTATQRRYIDLEIVPEFILKNVSRGD